MADRSHLIFPPKQETQRERASGFGGGKSVEGPPKERQEERLGPKFEAIERSSLVLAATAEGTAPEDVLVFEIAGEVQDFARAVRNAGLDLLLSADSETEADEDFFPLDGSGERKEGIVPERVYLTASSQEALRNVLSLYRRWVNEEPFDRGFTRWGDVFAQLVDVRLWDARDRLLDTGIVDYFETRLDANLESIPVEVELFFAGAADEREEREQRVRAAITEGGGRVTTRCELPDIRYHALLAELPAERAREILSGLDRLRESGVASDPLVQEVGVQFLRPAGQVATPLVPLEGSVLAGPDADGLAEGPTAGGAPVVALLDGLPLQNHSRLAGRLVIDVEAEVEDQYVSHLRQHGTAMASLIVWGDVNAEEAPLQRPLHVQPILRPHDTGIRMEEQVPDLVVDVIHRAVRRMLVGDGDGPTAPSVRVINLSVGESYRPFLNTMSPFGRLLDWLSYKYGVLFVVSAGNYGHHAELEGVNSETDLFGQLKDTEGLERALIADGHRDQRHRRIFAPAESLNALTVGATAHDHADGAFPPNVVPAYQTPDLPAFYSRRGPGPKRAIKPDVLNSGGRVGLRRPITGTEAKWRISDHPKSPPGHLVASPGPAGRGDLNNVRYCAGTSNAAALTSRAADQLYDVLWSLRRSQEGGVLDAAPEALWLKALLVHSASWPADAVAVVRSVLEEEGVTGHKMKDVLASVFGFGVVDPARVRNSADHRATLLGAGEIDHDGDHVWELPLPGSLSGKEGKRRLIVTLAWFVPPPLRVQTTRSVKLFFEAPNYKWVARQRQADHHGVQRGTVHHEVFEDEGVALPFAEDGVLTVHVKCNDREKDDRKTPLVVPYALIATVDVAAGVGVPVYEEVQAGVRARAQVRT